MKITAIDRMRTLPVHRDDEVWEVGLLEVAPPAGARPGAAAAKAMVCASGTRDGAAVVHADKANGPDDELALRAIAACALDPHTPGVRPWNYLPSKIAVGMLPPEMKRQLDEFFGPLSVVVEVKPRLERLEEMSAFMQMMREEEEKHGPIDDPPGLMTVPGMTLERVQAFAVAGRVFFDAKPWKAFAGNHELWEIQPPPPWAELSHCHLTGDLGEMYGGAFFKSPTDFEEFAARAAELGPEGVWDGLDGTYWTVSMDEKITAPLEDVVLWERESLPTCGKEQRIAVANGVSKGPVFARPTPEMLGFMETVLLAMASVKRADVQAGFFERTVKTGSGPRLISFAACEFSEPDDLVDEPGPTLMAPGGKVMRLTPGSPDLDELIELLGDSPVGKRLKRLKDGGREAEKPAKRKKKGRSAATLKPVKAGAVYQVKVTLNRAKPPIWRRLLVRDDTTLAQLHDALQIAFGWHNGHLHEFEVDGERFSRPPVGMPVDSFWDDGEANDSNDVRLSDLELAPKRKFKYVYDFGDNWEMTLAVEKALTAPEAEAAIAREPGAAAVWKRFTAATRTPAVACVAGARCGPPEDCGGVWGYAELCAIMADPNHPEHDERREWMTGLDSDERLAELFNPERFELEAINRALAKYVKA